MCEEIITKEFIKSILPKRKENSHKGSYGNVLNIAGSINYRGAAFLSSKSALEAGAGYVMLVSIEKVISLVSVLCPEAVFLPVGMKNGTLSNKDCKKIINVLPDFKVIEIGCGLSSMDKNQDNIMKFFEKIISEICKNNNQVIIDADGINILAENERIKIPPKSILTPHPKELSRLLKSDVSKIQEERVKFAKEAAQKYSSIIVLKGHNTVVTDGVNSYINKTGNSSLSKAGSGDVLTGMISGFCAQGAEPLNAAILGVYLHGLAGEIASEELSEYSVNASDLIDYIPKAINSLP